jgi:hypothetical protein
VTSGGWKSCLIKSLPKNIQRFSIGSCYFNNEVRKQHHY